MVTAVHVYINQAYEERPDKLKLCKSGKNEKEKKETGRCLTVAFIRTDNSLNLTRDDLHNCSEVAND